MGQFSLRIIAILFLLTACNPQQRALTSAKKHWEKIQDLLLKYPELADSMELIRRDTIRIEGFKATTEVVNDSTIWDAAFFGEVDTLASAVVKAPETKKALPVARLQKRICPELVKDSTYHIKVYNTTLTRYIPVHLSVKAKDGRIQLSILAEDVKVPDPEVTKSLEFKSVKPLFYRDQWFWVAVVLLVMLILLMLGLLRQRQS